MKKLTLTAWGVSVLILLGGCETPGSTSEPDPVFRLCASNTTHGNSYCTKDDSCVGGHYLYDIYSSISECNNNRYNSDVGGNPTNSNNSNSNNSNSSNDEYYPWLLCTKTTYDSSGRTYYAWSCYGNNECKPGYTWNAPIARHTVESCAAEGDDWLRDLGVL